MKTSQAWWVVEGNFRLLCNSQESVQKWVAYIVANGGVPQVEVIQ